ncbi:WecB/TagA/CpsF family glycosyltransferase [Halobacillus aidingensis]|uniref:N-acetylglucosaminyldiphosphoundecaprenol N-acetyl-beta-D-mannosaminyltransferase n=3 Tax=Halobacillus TaxID=45667 RepID=A0A1H0KP64_HALAD|nr:WecB/TagA/CpsF family glycosyltransferase [Halobacillus aidingensis]SDO57560.1 N-acetylglucosaminyldiphosphoundecaprenol N-acetyl-beta-D-mannosaminyltransferase [Halobacillus aidingensis]
MKEKFLGVDVSNYTYDQLKKNIMTDINEHRKSFIVAINPEKILQAQKDADLLHLLNTATYQIPDGVGILIASRMTGGTIRERVTGIDMLLALCEQASLHGKSVFLYGAKPGVAEKASHRLKEMYPDLKIAGIIDGYEKDQDHIKDTINQAKPDIVFVALGSPRQEYWIVDHMEEMDAKVFQGVGGSFDVLSGRVKRAPAVFQKVGLEWLYRLIKEPWRIKRQIKLPTFLLKVLKTKK